MRVTWTGHRRTVLAGKAGTVSAPRTRLTAYGVSLLPLVQKVEQRVAALEECIRQSSREMSGIQRLTCPEPILACIPTSPLLDHLRARHPGLRMEFVTTDHYVDLRQGAADVALRSGDTAQGHLVGRKVGESYWGICAGQGYLARRGAPRSVEAAAGHDWITLESSMVGHRSLTWLR